MTQAITTLATLKKPDAPAVADDIRAGFDTTGGFALMQRGAALLANSTIVPSAYRSKIEKKSREGGTQITDNPAAVSNCVVALNMAQRMGADPLMIMQNLYIVEGRPAWSSQYIIASINACGKYSPLRFDIQDVGEREVEYTVTKWVNRQPHEEKKKVTIQDRCCIAWAIEKATGERLDSPPVTMEMAVAEGWYGKNGSKWQTMPEVMLRYRAASFFGKLYAPELLMGIQTAEEVHDTTYDLERSAGGTFSITTADLQSTPPEPEPEATIPDAAATPPKEQRTTTAKPKASGESKPTQTMAQPEQQNAPTQNAAATVLTVFCHHKNKDVDELDCPDCPNRPGCPTWRDLE